MKFILLIVSLLTSNAFCQVNLLAFGDSGEIQAFKSKNCFKKNGVKTAKVDDFYNLFQNEKIVNHDGVCTMDEKEVEGELGLIHFQNVICNAKVANYIEKSDSVVILGDMVYPESKTYVYENDKKQANFDKYASKWVDRLRCGWNVFKRLLKDYSKVCKATVTKNANKIGEKLWKVDKLAEDFLLISGNHSYDVESKFEFEQMFGITVTKNDDKSKIWVKGDVEKVPTDWQAFLTMPRLSTYTKKGKDGNDVKVQFLDINTAMINCLGEGFPKKKEGEKDKDYFQRCMIKNGADRAYSRDEGIKYWRKVVDGIKSFDDNSDWRVIRSHHPPLNIEAADMRVFWSFKLTDTAMTKGIYKQRSQDKTLMENMKEKKVNLYIASHHHSAHVLAYNYNNETPFDQFKVPDPSFDNINNGCFGACETSSPFNGKFFTKKDAKGTEKAENWLYIFVIGNSGRFLDRLENDSRTRGLLLWGKGNGKQEELCSEGADFHRKYGGSNFAFDKTELNVNFFEVGAVTDVKVDIAKITVQNQSGDNNLASRLRAKFIDTSQITPTRATTTPVKASKVPVKKKILKK